MKDYGTAKSSIKPEEIVIDEYSVWVKTDITQTADGWEYHLEKYTKEEYIKMSNEQNQKTQADLEYLAMMTEVELE
ncbi:hypothetical protein SAMN02910436_02473 [Ruminococcaceae bacterium P7]|nr:hypothetical protein SAMN02910436_02473 [Ruminococcaceae bacterium P7]